MPVFARGYRPYEGTFRAAPAWWTIFREGYRTALRTPAMRRLRIMTLLIFSSFAMALYAAIGLRDFVGGAFGDPAEYSWGVMRGTLSVFYTGIMFLTSLIAILTSAGLVADDLRARALPLYLVRPIRPFAYALGKALVIPGILVWVALLPGPAFLLLVALWQPPGGTLSFLGAHLDLVTASVHHFLVASASYAGLALLISSNTTRRGAAAGLAAAVIFGGSMLQQMGSRAAGLPGEVLRALGIPRNTLLEILEVTSSNQHWYRRAEAGMAEPEHVIAVASALLAAGLWAAWRRARSVEVAG